MFSALQNASSPLTHGVNSIQNRCIIGDAILPQTGTKLTKNAVLNLSLCCGATWRHREKPQYTCTTTIHPVYNCSKKILENLLPVWVLVCTNLIIPSRFGLPIRNLTLALSARLRHAAKVLYRCTSTGCANKKQSPRKNSISTEL